jgi:hypothetical protein
VNRSPSTPTHPTWLVCLARLGARFSRRFFVPNTPSHCQAVEAGAFLPAVTQAGNHTARVKARYVHVDFPINVVELLLNPQDHRTHHFSRSEINLCGS